MGVFIVVVGLEESARGFWEQFYGPNIGYVQQQYELFKKILKLSNHQSGKYLKNMVHLRS